ncbi:hypothetical protein V1523DRAFT_385255 [Lipomyces doorenjongii]
MYKSKTGDNNACALHITSFIYEEYCNQYGRVSRDSGALRRKFNQIANLPKPAGDPTCPPDIRRAKEIDRMLNDSLEMTGLDDGEILDLTEKHEGEQGDAGSRLSNSPTAKPVALRSESGDAASHRTSNTPRVGDVMESFVSFLGVERQEERERKTDVIMLYRSQIESLEMTLRDSQTEHSATSEKADLEIRFQRERSDLVAAFT